MPTITETPVELYAFCMDGACPGYKQTKVEGIARETSVTFFDQGSPNMPGVSHSFFHYIAPSGDLDETGSPIPDETPCEFCGGPRAFSTQERPKYPRANPQDPNELLNMRNRDDRLRDGELADARQTAEVQTLRAELAEMKALLATKPARRAKAEPDGEAA